MRTPQDLDVEAIALGESLFILEEALDGAEARLVGHGDRAIALVREAMPYVGMKRFAAAHELGHWLLHRDLRQSWSDDVASLHDYRKSPEEVEANTFAAALLVPLFILRRFEIPVIMEAALEVADIFRVGPFAAARRCVSGLGSGAQMVVSDGRQVRYYVRCDRCTLPAIKPGTPVPPGPTATARETIGKVVAGRTYPSQWVGRGGGGDAWIEEAIRPSEDPSILTILRPA